MARPNSGNDLFAIKPQSHFYASAEAYLSTMQVSEWYGLGKYSAEEKDVFPYPQALAEMGFVLQAEINTIGGHWLVTSPIFIRAEFRKTGIKEYKTNYIQVVPFRLRKLRASGHDCLFSADMAIKRGLNAAFFDENSASKFTITARNNTQTYLGQLKTSTPAPAQTFKTASGGVTETATQAAMSGIVAAAASLFVSQMKKVAEESDNSKSAKMQDKT